MIAGLAKEVLSAGISQGETTISRKFQGADLTAEGMIGDGEGP